MKRHADRATDELRPVSIERHYTKYAEGSVLVAFGDTRVLCTATTEEKIPLFLRGRDKGWVTAEYGMLPRSTGSRTAREASRGRQSGRTLEIQRLIGRSLRAVVDMRCLGERTVILDCDVLQADGGTRTASITGAYVALVDAIKGLRDRGTLEGDPVIGQVASVSAGIVNNEVLLDLDYAEDFDADTDMNFVIDDNGRFIEVQGTAESGAFTLAQLNKMAEYAQKGVSQLLEYQRRVLAD